MLLGAKSSNNTKIEAMVRLAILKTLNSGL